MPRLRTRLRITTLTTLADLNAFYVPVLLCLRNSKCSSMQICELSIAGAFHRGIINFASGYIKPEQQCYCVRGFDDVTYFLSPDSTFSMESVRRL
jgi:hypothetical protein